MGSCPVVQWLRPIVQGGHDRGEGRRGGVGLSSFGGPEGGDTEPEEVTKRMILKNCVTRLSNNRFKCNLPFEDMFNFFIFLL